MSDDEDLGDFLAISEENEDQNQSTVSESLESFITADERLFNFTTESLGQSFTSAVSAFERTARDAIFDNGSFNDDQEADRETPVASSSRDTFSTPGPQGSASTSRLIPFDQLSKKLASSSSKRIVTQLRLFDSDSEDDDIHEKPSLNESGRELQRSIKQRAAEEEERQLEKKASTSHPQENPSTARAPKTDVFSQPSTSKGSLSGPISAFDNFFGLKIRNPKVSSLAFETVTEGMKKIRLSSMKKSTDIENSVSMGVIVEKSEPRKSANGSQFMIWKLHDLMNCQDIPVKVLLFGECAKEFWKLQVGCTVALVCPVMADQSLHTQSSMYKVKDSGVTLKVFKKSQIVELGFCPSYGTCKGVRNDNQLCTNFVNMDVSEYCVYHVMSAARKLSSKRGVFSNPSTAPVRHKPPTLPTGLMVNKPNILPSSRSSMHPAGTMKASSSTTIMPNNMQKSRTVEKISLGQIMGDRAHLPGARNLMRYNSSKDSKTTLAPLKPHASMADFVKERTAEVAAKATTSRPPTLGFGLSGTGGVVNLASKAGPTRMKEAAEYAAKKRAISVLSRSKSKETIIRHPSKRGNDEAADVPCPKREKLGSLTNKEELEKLLKKKSVHDKEAEKEEVAATDRYLNAMEAKEKVESFVTECASVKNVKVITCAKCGYTAQHQSELCMRNGHLIKRHTAEKRFFKCKNCHKRTTAFGLLPAKPCEHCDVNDWERVTMRDERKVTLENEKLALRGEERKFVNK